MSEQELFISPRDLGFSRGYAVFDFLVTYGHEPYMLKKHINRLFRSADAIALTIPWAEEQVCEWILQTLNANKAINGEKVIRVTISGGLSFTLTPPSFPTIVITIDPMVYCPQQNYVEGVAVNLIEFQRYRPEAKTNNYIEAVRSLRDINLSDIDEIIYHSGGMIREGSRCNVFAVIKGRLLTPKTDILEGVTRGVLLDILKLEIPIVVEDFSVDALLTASEVFITATGKEVMPVTKIDSRVVGDGEVGSITKDVMNQHHAFVYSDLWR